MAGSDEAGMGKTLAIDWGWARLGLAVSDDLGLTAHAVESLARKSEAQVLDAIEAHVRGLGIEAIVVGLPRNMDGSDGPSAEAARTFAQRLEARAGVPVHLWDERLTTLARPLAHPDSLVPRTTTPNRLKAIGWHLLDCLFADHHAAQSDVNLGIRKSTRVFR